MPVIGGAWVLKWTDIGREDEYVVFLNKDAAVTHAGRAAAGFAQEELERFDWGEDGPPEALTDTLKAAEKGDYDEVMSFWADYASDAEPDQSVEIIETNVLE